MSWTWAFDVAVTYDAPDQHGTARQWTAHERLTAIGNGGMSEEDARAIAQRLLDTNEHTRQFILGKYPAGATATLGIGDLYEEHLIDPHD